MAQGHPVVPWSAHLPQVTFQCNGLSARLLLGQGATFSSILVSCGCVACASRPLAPFRAGGSVMSLTDFGLHAGLHRAPLPGDVLVADDPDISPPVPLGAWLKTASERMGGEALRRRQLNVLWWDGRTLEPKVEQTPAKRRLFSPDANSQPTAYQGVATWRAATIRQFDAVTCSFEVKYHDEAKRSQAHIWLPLAVLHFARNPPANEEAIRSSPDAEAVLDVKLGSSPKSATARRNAVPTEKAAAAIASRQQAQQTSTGAAAASALLRGASSAAPVTPASPQSSCEAPVATPATGAPLPPLPHLASEGGAAAVTSPFTTSSTIKRLPVVRLVAGRRGATGAAASPLALPVKVEAPAATPETAADVLFRANRAISRAVSHEQLPAGSDTGSCCSDEDMLVPHVAATATTPAGMSFTSKAPSARAQSVSTGGTVPQPPASACTDFAQLWTSPAKDGSPLNQHLQQPASAAGGWLGPDPSALRIPTPIPDADDDNLAALYAELCAEDWYGSGVRPEHFSAAAYSAATALPAPQVWQAGSSTAPALTPAQPQLQQLQNGVLGWSQRVQVSYGQSGGAAAPMPGRTCVHGTAGEANQPPDPLKALLVEWNDLDADVPGAWATGQPAKRHCGPLRA